MSAQFEYMCSVTIIEPEDKLENNACYSTLAMPQCKMVSYTGVTYHTTLTLTSHQKLFHKKMLMSGVGLQTHELSLSEEGSINLLCSASVKLFNAQVKLDLISLHI